MPTPPLRGRRRLGRRRLVAGRRRAAAAGRGNEDEGHDGQQLPRRSVLACHAVNTRISADRFGHAPPRSAGTNWPVKQLLEARRVTAHELAAEAKALRIAVDVARESLGRRSSRASSRSARAGAATTAVRIRAPRRVTCPRRSAAARGSSRPCRGDHAPRSTLPRRQRRARLRAAQRRAMTSCSSESKIELARELGDSLGDDRRRRARAASSSASSCPRSRTSTCSFQAHSVW